MFFLKSARSLRMSILILYLFFCFEEKPKAVPVG